MVTQNEARPLTINRSIIDLMISYLNTDEKPDGFIMFKEQSIYTYIGLNHIHLLKFMSYLRQVNYG